MREDQIREELHLVIDRIEEYKVLEAVYQILEKQYEREHLLKSEDVENEFGLKNSLERAISQIEKGEYVEHSQVWKSINSNFLK